MKTPEEIGTEIMRDYHKTRVQPYSLVDAIAAALTSEREAREKAEAALFHMTTAFKDSEADLGLVRARADRIQRETIERCAKVAEKAYLRWAGQALCPVECDVTACDEIARAIRALGEPSP